MGVKVRVKRRKLYLDIYQNGKRVWESLGLTVSDDPAVNRENTRLAEYARAKREQQIFSGQWGLQDRLGAKKPLYSYLEGMAEGRDKQKDRVCKVLPWLEKYPGGKEIQIGQVTAKWFSNFQNYLIKDTGLSEQSASSYAYAVRMALRQAVRENIRTMRGKKAAARPRSGPGLASPPHHLIAALSCRAGRQAGAAIRNHGPAYPRKKKSRLAVFPPENFENIS
jgi:hypothetical protein